MATADGSCEMPAVCPTRGYSGHSIKPWLEDVKIDRVVEISPSTTAISPCAVSAYAEVSTGARTTCAKGRPGNAILAAGVALACRGIVLSRGVSSWLVSNIEKLQSRISGVWTEFSLHINCFA